MTSQNDYIIDHRSTRETSSGRLIFFEIVYARLVQPKAIFNQWKQNGFPRDNENVQYNRYRLARKEFRNLTKKYQNASTMEHYVNIERIKNVQPKKYWQQIKLSKQSKNQKLFTINNKTQTKDIVEEFGKHFSNIFNKPRIENIDNTKSNKLLEEIIADLNLEENENYHITELDITEAIDSLKKNKVFDPFDLKAEHFKNAPSCLHKYLAQLVNEIINLDELPSMLATSTIVPLVKSYQKSLNDGNNYRGISLIPMITKIIEKTIVNKCPNIKDHKDVQFGFASNSSTIHAELLIKDTIKKYNKEGTPVYICSLDAEKAFDSCNWHILFQSLSQKKIIPEIVLKFLIKLYLKGEAKIEYIITILNTLTYHKELDKVQSYHPFFTIYILKTYLKKSKA